MQKANLNPKQAEQAPIANLLIIHKTVVLYPHQIVFWLLKTNKQAQMEWSAYPALKPRLNYSFSLFQECELSTVNREFSGQSTNEGLSQDPVHSPKEDEIICIIRLLALPPKGGWLGLETILYFLLLVTFCTTSFP